MQFVTQHFGIVEYEQDAVFEFPSGLPGFEDERSFIPLQQAATKPIVFLQSLARPDLCFITLPVNSICPGYRLAIAPEDLLALGFEEDRQPEIGAEVLCLAIISVSDGGPPSANLLAPVVVNVKTRRALQAIQSDSGYSHRHVLLAGDKEEACSSSAAAQGSRS